MNFFFFFCVPQLYPHASFICLYTWVSSSSSSALSNYIPMRPSIFFTREFLLLLLRSLIISPCVLHLSLHVSFFFFCVPQLYPHASFICLYTWVSSSSAFPNYIPMRPSFVFTREFLLLLLRSPIISPCVLHLSLHVSFFFFCVPQLYPHASFIFLYTWVSSSSSAFPKYISGVHHVWWDFWVCDRFSIQPLR